MLSRYTLLQTALTVIILSLNFYGITESLKYNSWKGFLLAIAGIVALLFCLKIIRELKRLDTEADSEMLNV
jgi:hypothetical protein